MTTFELNQHRIASKVSYQRIAVHVGRSQGYIMKLFADKDLAPEKIRFLKSCIDKLKPRI